MHESQIGSRETVLASVSPSLTNLITEVTFQNDCHSLFVKRKVPNPVHTYRERILQKVCFRRWEWLRDKLVSTSHNLNSFYLRICLKGFPGGSEGKTSACNKGNPSSSPGSGRSLGERNDNPLQYSCLENPKTQEPRSWGRKDSDMTEWLHFTFTKQWKTEKKERRD